MLSKYYIKESDMYVVPYSVWSNNMDIIREVLGLMVSDAGNGLEWVYEANGENVTLRKVCKVRPSIDEICNDEVMCLYSVDYLYDEFMCSGNMCQLLRSMLRVSINLGEKKGNYCISVIPGQDYGYQDINYALIRIIPSLKQ